MPFDTPEKPTDENGGIEPRGRRTKNRDTIIEAATDLVKLHDFPDYGPMGLQFKGDESVRKIAAAVSVSKDVIERAAAEGAQLLIVHHGMFWNNESRILDERVGGRLEALERHGITLLAYHLALDAHPEFGNNILLARNLGLGSLTPWEKIGWSGRYKTPMYGQEWNTKMRNKLEIPRGEGFFFHFGERYINKVAVIAGGAAQYIVQAHRDGFDTFVTGEASEPSYYLAQDLGMNFFAFGHDKTERAGVTHLASLLARKFRIPHVFLPVDNPI